MYAVPLVFGIQRKTRSLESVLEDPQVADAELPVPEMDPVKHPPMVGMGIGLEQAGTVGVGVGVRVGVGVAPGENSIPSCRVPLPGPSRWATSIA